MARRQDDGGKQRLYGVQEMGYQSSARVPPIQERGDGPNHCPNAAELVERMNNAVPVSKREILQIIERIQAQSNALQTHVLMLEQQKEESQQQVTALALQVQKLQLQVETRISTTATAREEWHRTEMQANSQLWQARQHLASGIPVHAFSPDTSLDWKLCECMPMEMSVAKTTVVGGCVYMGGGNTLCKYDPARDRWDTPHRAPEDTFGVGNISGKLFVVGGRRNEKGVTDVYIFEEDSQQPWVRHDPPMPVGLAFVRVESHDSALVVCGMPDAFSPATVLVYDIQLSEWHNRTAPVAFNSAYCSGVFMNNKYYLAMGAEGVVGSNRHRSSPEVYCQPLSTLLDPMCSQDPFTWQRMPDTPCHRSHLAVTGGCLLALGGYHNECNLMNDKDVAANVTSEIHAYCPATTSWVKIGGLPGRRACFATSTLSSGELFIAGGHIRSEESDRLNIDNKVFTGIIKCTP